MGLWNYCAMMQWRPWLHNGRHGMDIVAQLLGGWTLDAVAMRNYGVEWFGHVGRRIVLG